MNGQVRDALVLAQEEDWLPAIETDGARRDRAWLTDQIPASSETTSR